MIFVQSYFKNKDSFIEYDKFDSKIDDSDYIQGAIELKINDVEIINKSMFDYIDQLWAYIVDGLVDVSQRKDFYTYFPDQPIKFSINYLYGDMIKVSLICDNEVNATIDKNIFIKCISSHIKNFMTKMKYIAPNNIDIYEDMINKLDSITK